MILFFISNTSLTGSFRSNSASVSNATANWLISVHIPSAELSPRTPWLMIRTGTRKGIRSCCRRSPAGGNPTESFVFVVFINLPPEGGSYSGDGQLVTLACRQFVLQWHRLIPGGSGDCSPPAPNPGCRPLWSSRISATERSPRRHRPQSSHRIRLRCRDCRSRPERVNCSATGRFHCRLGP